MRTGILAILAVALCAGSALAQSGTRDYLNSLSNRPALSPYLGLAPENLNNIDAYSGRYQTIVRPQVESRRPALPSPRSFQGLQQPMSQIPLNTSMPPTAAPHGYQVRGSNVTGHPTYFNTRSHYYAR